LPDDPINFCDQTSFDQVFFSIGHAKAREHVTDVS